MANVEKLESDNLPSHPKATACSEPNNWMKSLKKTVTLREVLLFGTHDSGALAGRAGNMSITEQLLNGVRFLDLQLAAFEGETWVYHGEPCITLLNVIIEIESFVCDFGESEKVIIHMVESEDAPSPVDWESVKKLINKGTHNFLIPNTQAAMPISKMKGSVILLASKALDIPGNWGEGAIAHFKTPVFVVGEKDLREFILADDAFKKVATPVWVECRSRQNEETRQAIEVRAMDNYLVSNFGKASFNIVTFSSVDRGVFSVLKPSLLLQ